MSVPSELNQEWIQTSMFSQPIVCYLDWPLHPTLWGGNHMKQHCHRYHLVQYVVEDFWKRWTELCAPALVVQRKWYTARRNLRSGNVMIVADKNTLRGDYCLALVKDVFPGEDGKVRKLTVQSKSYRTGERVHEHMGARDTVVSRAVQRIALLVLACFGVIC